MKEIDLYLLNNKKWKDHSVLNLLLQNENPVNYCYSCFAKLSIINIATNSLVAPGITKFSFDRW